MPTEKHSDGHGVYLDTDDRPSGERLEALRSTFGDVLVRSRFQPLTDEPFRAVFMAERLDGVVVASLASSPMWFESAPERDEKRVGGLLLEVVASGEMSLRQAERTAQASGGGGAICHDRLPFLNVAPVPFRLFIARLDEVMLRPAVGDIERVAGMTIPAHIPEMRLLPYYLGGLLRARPLDESGLRDTLGAHVRELVTSAITRVLRLDDPTEGRGIRAARLEEVKRIVDAQLGQPTLNAVRVARQLGVTERYVQMLLEDVGTTFSAYVMEKRLTKAHRLLAWDRAGSLAIREIAWACGFSDPSHFARVFRRRFGETPSAVRGTARDPDGGQGGS